VKNEVLACATLLSLSRETWTALLLSLILSFPVGVISGIYSGLIVAQYQRFADLRAKIGQLILEINFVEEGSKVIFPRRTDVSELDAIFRHLHFLGHHSAADQVLQLSNEIVDGIYRASRGMMSFESFDQKYGEWQQKQFGLKPSRFRILWPSRL